MSKFRKWLIKKLGGYTEQITPPPVQIIETTNKVKTLEAVLAVHKNQPMSPNVIKNSLWEKLKEEINLDITATTFPFEENITLYKTNLKIVEK